MATKSSSHPVPVDCEVCRHYTGTAYIFQFGCAKGQCQEKTWTLKREACADFALMSRQEQILKRFAHSAKHYGERDIKKHRAEVRRMASGMQKTLESFSRFMTMGQIEAIKAASLHLADLGDDLELAGRLANTVQKNAEAERQRQEKARRAALVEKHFGDMTPADCLALCQDLVAFDSRDGSDWLRCWKRNPDAFVNIFDSHVMGNALLYHARAPSPATLAAVKEAASLCIDDLKQPKRSLSYATWADFETFRAWHRDIAATLARIGTPC